ncbi:MAG: hypothetical protein NVS4B1_01910 [Ktedonobacteraceae bacterium]
MQRIAVQNVLQQNRSRRHVLIGTLLALCIISASATALWVYTRTATIQTPTSQADPVIPYTGHRSSEVPLSSSRSLAMVEAHAPTSFNPWAMALDPARGYVWVAEPGCEPLPTCPTSFASVIGQYAYSDGTFIQDFAEPKGFTGPLFIVNDPAGHLWFTQPTSDAIGEFDPINNVWQQWPVKKNAYPYDLVLDAHGNLWFTEWGGNQIGFFDTHTHTLVETPIPTAHTNPYGITIDQKGTVWFAENAPLGQIGSFTTTANGTIKIVEHTVTALRPHLITTDKAGNIWFTEGFAGYISEYNPVNGAEQRFRAYLGACLNPATCTGTHISGIRVDDNGNVWFSDSLSQQIGYLVPATGQVVTRVLKPNSHPHDGLTLDNNGRVWFTEQYGKMLNVWPMSAIK